MTDLRNLSAYADFVCECSLEELASRLSETLFAGVRFVGLGEGIWDEVPAVRLEKDFLGLRVELGGLSGPNGGYTLQFEAFDFPWEFVGAGEEAEATVDLTGYLRYLLERVDGVILRNESYD